MIARLALALLLIPMTTGATEVETRGRLTTKVTPLVGGLPTCRLQKARYRLLRELGQEQLEYEKALVQLVQTQTEMLKRGEKPSAKFSGRKKRLIEQHGNTTLLMTSLVPHDLQGGQREQLLVEAQWRPTSSERRFLDLFLGQTVAATLRLSYLQTDTATLTLPAEVTINADGIRFSRRFSFLEYCHQPQIHLEFEFPVSCEQGNCRPYRLTYQAVLWNHEEN